MKRHLLFSVLAISTALLFGCTSDDNDSSDSSESQKGELKVIETSRIVSISGKVKDEDIIKYFYENKRLVSKKTENTIYSVAPSGSSIDNYSYDSSGKLIKKIILEKSLIDDSYSPLYIYEYSYNEKGQISEQNRNIVASNSSSKNSITNFSYDDLGRLIKITNPDFIYGPQTYAYYGSSFNIKPYNGGTQYDTKINMARFLSPTKAYADAYPYSANNVVFSEKIFTYDSQNRIIKIKYPADYNNDYETTYEYID